MYCKRAGSSESFVFSWADALQNLHGNRKQTKKLLNEDFAKELKDGRITFERIDISKSENEKIADKYRIAYSSLLIEKGEGAGRMY